MSTEQNTISPEPNKFTKWIISICIAFAIILSFTGMLLPPPGMIDNSVLILIAEVLVFCTTVLGIKNSNVKLIKKISELIKEENKKTGK